jgi:hypothetical protein
MRAEAKKACILPCYKIKDKLCYRLDPRIKKKIAWQRKTPRLAKGKIPPSRSACAEEVQCPPLIRELVRLPPVRASHSFLPRRASPGVPRLRGTIAEKM